MISSGDTFLSSLFLPKNDTQQMKILLLQATQQEYFEMTLSMNT
jgi:hypothetical protein